MTVRRWMIVWGLAVLVAASFLACFKAHREIAQRAAGSGQSLTALHDAPAQTASNDNKVAASVDTVIRVNVTNVLAKINGREITLADLIPLNSAKKIQEQEFSATTYKYLLDRAVNRELTLQVAKAQDVELDDSQRQRLAHYRGERKLPEPGLIQQINVDDAQIDFEVRDAEALMLQTTLLNKVGASPNVNEQEARDYYDQHVTEFGALPADEPARSRAWAFIDSQIRTQLAPTKRAQFQSQLTAYMDQVKSSANIAMSPAP